MMYDNEWHLGRWWRVLDASGGIWCETSSESEAREAKESAPGGGTLWRMWYREEMQWRPDGDTELSAG